MSKVADIIASIIEEMESQGHERVWLASQAVEYMVDTYNEALEAGVATDDLPKASECKETVMRMLRGETEGGAYLIDACLAVLKMNVKPKAKRSGYT